MSHLMPGFVLVLSHISFFNIHSCLKMSMFEEILLHNSTNCLLKAYQDLPWHTSLPWDNTYRCEILFSGCCALFSLSSKSFEDGKKSRIPERASVFLSFVAKSNFSVKVVSLCFIGLGSNESIQESSEGVTLFSQIAEGNFHFWNRDWLVFGCWFGVPICSHRSDRSTFFDLKGNHQVQTILLQNVCSLDLLRPYTCRMQSTQKHLNRK